MIRARRRNEALANPEYRRRDLNQNVGGNNKFSERNSIRFLRRRLMTQYDGASRLLRSLAADGGAVKLLALNQQTLVYLLLLFSQLTLINCIVVIKSILYAMAVVFICLDNCCFKMLLYF